MAPLEEMHTAMINRSIRTIKAELEYLCDVSVITPQTLSDLLSRVPEQTALHAPISVGAVPSAPAAAGTLQPPTSPLHNLHLRDPNGSHAVNNTDERTTEFYQPSSGPPPPAYNNPPPPPAPSWPPLCTATALYAYSSSDAGDLELQPNDHVTVTEYMNAEWWKGRSSRTGREGIFPRSYVKVVEEKGVPPVPPTQQATDYGNAPLDVSGMGSGDGKAPSKVGEMGKKFGKKLGNAAIFGAGATIGSDIVNAIL